MLCCEKHMNITKGAILLKDLDITLLQCQGTETYVRFRSRVLLFKGCIVVVGVAVLISVL